MISEMNFLERIIYLLQNYGISFLQGAGTTLAIAIVSTIIGCIIVLPWVSYRPFRLIRRETACRSGLF